MVETKFKTVENAEVIKEINRDEMVITHYISTRTPDRYDEIMNPKGCDDMEYRKNPVVFFGHRARDLPIAKNIKLSADDYGVIAVTKFDSSEFAKEVFRLNTEGFLNSWSIGFIPLVQPEVKDKYLYYERWKLLEYSSVPIPANPDAVNLMLKDVKNEKVREVIEEHNYRLNTLEELEDLIVQKIIGNIDSRLDELGRSIEERTEELERNIDEKIKSKCEEIMCMPFKAGESKGVISDEMRHFEDRIVRKLQTLINNKAI